jgi:hypothetical protein
MELWLGQACGKDMKLWQLEQKWASRIEQILAVRSTAPPLRDPNDDDDDEVEDEESEDQRLSHRALSVGGAVD